jgi:hypothetical protein
MRTAHLEPGACREELRRLDVPHWLEKPSPKGRRADGDLATPLRLTGPLDGVRFEAPEPPIAFGKLDCRLAVALASLARWAKRYQVVSVRVDNMYRPDAIVAEKNKPSQHAVGLAIDIMAFGLHDGSELLVKRDWHGVVGKPYCGPGAVLTQRNNRAATALRDLVCNVIRAGLFHHAVTPSDNRAHHDHLHFDLDPAAKRVRVEP